MEPTQSLFTVQHKGAPRAKWRDGFTFSSEAEAWINARSYDEGGFLCRATIRVMRRDFDHEGREIGTALAPYPADVV